MRKTLTILIFFCPFLLIGQEISGGFKAGLNFSRIEGPSEVDSNGDDLEEFNFTTGFHIGGSVYFKFTDRFGFRTEILYSQKGTEYTFEGESFWLFPVESGNDLISFGNRRTELEITNSYIDIPIMGYVKLGRVEFSAGVNAAFLVSSRGTGNLTYSGQTQLGNNIDPFNINLDFNYFSDNFQRFPTGDTQIVTVDGSPVDVPEEIGAYYETVTKSDSFFNIVDVGLNAGVAFFLNQGLYLGFRVNYGLLDISKAEQDISASVLGENNSFINLDQTDQNLSLQTSIGFSF